MDDSIRVSDADRGRVTAQLGDHFAASRITPGELDDRLSAALNASRGSRKHGDATMRLADDLASHAARLRHGKDAA